MKRWHEDYPKTYRQWKIHHKSHVDSNKDRMKAVGYDPYKVDCECDNQVGRFRKKDAWDCGNPRCGICHQDKFPERQLTNKEIQSKLNFKEQVKEFRE